MRKFNLSLNEIIIDFKKSPIPVIIDVIVIIINGRENFVLPKIMKIKTKIIIHRSKITAVKNDVFKVKLINSLSLFN